MALAAAGGDDPRERRREIKVAGIVDEAWSLARRDGLGALSLRELAAAVGLRQPSLYVYFASKNELYDAMFSGGYRELLDFVAAQEYPQEPRAALTQLVTDLVRFSSDDFVRHQLLFQRTIPGFEPSQGSMELANEFYGIATAFARAAGATRPQDIDVFSAMVAGLAHQQTANDPGGGRWVAHVPRVVDMFIADLRRQQHTTDDPHHSEGRR